MSRRLEYLPLSELVPADRNPKRHDLPGVASSMTRFGFTQPVLLDERTGKLTAGHGRTTELRARKDHGDPPPAGIEVDEHGEWLVPVIRGWASTNDHEAEAYIIADNKLVEAGGWDSSLLAEMAQGLHAAEVGFEGTGLKDYELDVLLQTRWEPPAPREGGDLSDFSRSDGNQHGVTFGPGERAIVDQAGSLVRVVEGNTDLTLAQAIVVMARGYLATHAPAATPAP